MKITAPSADHEAMGGVSTSQHHTKYSDANAIAAVVEDAAYGSGWNSDTTHAPSQNAVYDKINAMNLSAQANQAAIQGETNQDTYIPPDLVKFIPGLPTTYGSHDGGGNLISGSVNLASTAQTATGLFTWTFTTEYDDALYHAIGNNASQGNNTHSTTGAETAGLWYERCALANTGALQDGAFTLAIIGILP